MSKSFYKFAAIGLAVVGLAGCNGYYRNSGDGGFYSSSSDNSNDYAGRPHGHHRDNNNGGFYGNTATGFVSNAASSRRNGGFSGSGSATGKGGFSS
mgnify:CR=1 FL=1